MRTLATLFLAVAVCALMGVGGAAADDDSRQQKPDSIVHCLGDIFGPDYSVVNSTVPASVNLDQCVRGVSGACSPCIRSLEEQHCKVVDVIVVGPVEHSLPVTFLLSCAKP